MPELEAHNYVALPPEERSRIATARMEELERAFFNAQLGMALEKANLDTNDAEAVAEFNARKQQTFAAHKRQMAAVAKIVTEARAAIPAQPVAPAGPPQ